MNINKRRHLEHYLSATGIARRLGRSHKAVILAIARLGIPADAHLALGHGYKESRVAEIEAGMRRKNGEPTPTA